MSDDVKGFLERMANEMPELRAPRPRALRHARRAAAVTLVCSLLIVSGLGIAAFAGIRSLSVPPERTVQPPVPVTAQNGRIAFVRAGRPPITDPGQTIGTRTWPHVFTMQPDGTDVRRLTTGRFIDQWPSWSPDGRHLVFSRASAPPSTRFPMPVVVTYSLYSIGADGGDLTRLTHLSDSEGGGDMHAAWSPDGSRIAFARALMGSTGLMLMNADGTDAHLLRGEFSYLGGLAWSPDGLRIAMAAGERTGPRVVIVSAQNGDVLNAYPLEGLGRVESVSWSPRGDVLAVGAETSPAGRRSAVYLLDVTRRAPRPRLLTDCRPDCRSGDSEPAWSPDGKQVVFVRGPGAYSAGQVWVVSADGTGQRQFTDGSLLDSSPAWQPET